MINIENSLCITQGFQLVCYTYWSAKKFHNKKYIRDDKSKWIKNEMKG